MNGGYTKVPLRREERWTGARMQQGRVLLDHEWNLNLDAGARAAEAAAADTIGHAGVPVGSTAFQVSVTPAGPLDLTIEPGRMWVDGMLVLAPEQFGYRSQDEIDVPGRLGYGVRLPRRLPRACPAGRGPGGAARSGVVPDRHRGPHAHRLPGARGAHDGDHVLGGGRGADARRPVHGQAHGLAHRAVGSLRPLRPARRSTRPAARRALPGGGAGPWRRLNGPLCLVVRERGAGGGNRSGRDRGRHGHAAALTRLSASPTAISWRSRGSPGGRTESRTVSCTRWGPPGAAPRGRCSRSTAPWRRPAGRTAWRCGAGTARRWGRPRRSRPRCAATTSAFASRRPPAITRPATGGARGCARRRARESSRARTRGPTGCATRSRPWRSWTSMPAPFSRTAGPPSRPSPRSSSGPGPARSPCARAMTCRPRSTRFPRRAARSASRRAAIRSALRSW